MKLPSEIHPLWIQVFWVTPFLLPALSIYHAMPLKEAEITAGMEWLALPVAFATYESEVSWEGWALVLQENQVEEATVGEEQEPGSSNKEIPPPLHSRVVLSGTISAGGELLYCFFDTQNGRWFRMRPGEWDMPSGLFLEVEGSEVRLFTESGHEILPELADGLRERSLPYLTAAH